MSERGDRDWPWQSGRRRSRRRLGREEHRRPRGREGTHPGRSSRVRNAVTPSGSGRAFGTSGKPTARRAQLPGGNRMTEKRNAPRGALLYPRRSREELEGGFLGPMAYPDPKGERNSSMPAKRWSGPGVRAGASRDPRDMAKAGLPKSQSPDDANSASAGKAPDTGATLCDGIVCGRRNLRSGERCPVRAIKEMSGTPTSRSDVRQGRTRDQPSGREPRGDGVPVVVVGAIATRGRT